MRGLAKVYAVIVAVLLTYAWYGDISLRNSQTEHLLGDALLWFASLPASLSVMFFHDCFEKIADLPFAELTWISGCAVIQVSVLLLRTRPAGPGRAGS